CDVYISFSSVKSSGERLRKDKKTILGQAAIEYLSNYILAVLIIIIILILAVKYGLFNSNVFLPKAQPGTCQVSRPYGATTTGYIQLLGSCYNQLPQFVSTMSQSANTYV